MHINTIKDILKYRNINNQVYACDIKRYFGIDCGEKVYELQNLLTEIDDYQKQNTNAGI